MSVVRVKYNGKEIFSLSNNQKGILNCINEKMSYSLVVIASRIMQGNMRVIYNGEEIASLTAGQKLTLNCTNMRMLDNITFSPIVEEGGGGQDQMSNFVLSNGDLFITADGLYFNVAET